MPVPALRPMRARDAAEEHRASTPLELFFDLTFVVAVSLAATGLAHQIESGHAGHGVAVFVQIFFAIWWGWLNFTWFASAYDTDDWLYRVVTLVQMGGALTVAAGVPRVFEHGDFLIVVVGYVIMRLAMVFQWLRAMRNDAERRPTARIYVVGIVTVQVLWCLRLALPAGLATASFVVLVLGEIAVPATAERRATTSFHRQHVVERYGLFTIIVLGEGVLATGNSIIEALQGAEHVAALVVLAVGGLALLAGMWWLYFATEPADELDGYRKVFAWGYGHYGIFAAAAAVSSGLEVQVAHVVGTGDVSAVAARLSLAVPIAVFVLLVWALVVRPTTTGVGDVVVIAGGLLLLAGGFLPLPVEASTVLEAVLLAVLVGYLVAAGARGSIAAGPPVHDADRVEDAAHLRGSDRA